MSTPPAGIPEADWLATPASVRTLILAQQQEIQALRQENDELRSQLTALASELAQLRERIGRSSRNSSKPPSSDGPGYRCAEALRATSPQPKRRARAPAASAAAKTVILVRAATSFQRSSARMSSPISPQPAVVAVRRSVVRIQNRTAIKWSTFQRSSRS